MPRLGLALTKKAVNQAEDAMGLQVGMDSVFGLHHLAHAHNAETGTDSLAGHDARSMRDAPLETRGATGRCLVNDEQFRAEVRGWLTTALASAEFACLVGKGGTGRAHEFVAERMAWERRLGADGWIGLGWPEADGGRGLPWHRQVIFYEEYARANAPGRVGHIGEQLVAPTLLMFGTPEQKARFLPGIAAGTELWCQGYSEPGAGSDLAGLRTRASLRDGEWHIDGQKIWTSLAHVADWCFLLARTEAGSDRHRGLSCLLVPVRQPGIEIRPITQITGTAEFNEVFFDDARTGRGQRGGRAGRRLARGARHARRRARRLQPRPADRLPARVRVGARRGPRQRERRRSRHRRADRRRLDRAAGHAVHGGGRPGRRP